MGSHTDAVTAAAWRGESGRFVISTGCGSTERPEGRTISAITETTGKLLQAENSNVSRSKGTKTFPMGRTEATKLKKFCHLYRKTDVSPCRRYQVF
jgi:hypothetical protein